MDLAERLDSDPDEMRRIREECLTDRIRAEAEAIRSNTEKEMSVLRARAEDRLDKAAERIVERIVSG